MAIRCEVHNSTSCGPCTPPKPDEISCSEKKLLAGLVVMALRKERRRIAKYDAKRGGPFVPESGKRDVAYHRLNSLEKVLEKLGGENPRPKEAC